MGVSIFCVSAISAEAATAVKPKVPVPAPLEISGWVPYWRKATGTIDTMAHLGTFKEINPFGYTVKKDGTLFDAMKISEEPWPAMIAAARAKKIRIIPTVMWSDGDTIDAILRSPKARKAHIDAIMQVVKENNFDGIDIDYEAKKAETKPYFSAFLKELYAAMGKKWVMCTIEPRTPLEARYDTIPKDIEYANDFVAINKYCDRVRIMAYDQGAIDLRLNDANQSAYVPIADPKWVEKVINLTAKTISKKKIVLGIPTYGYEYELKPLTEGYRYERLWSFNPRYATELATEHSLNPMRNSAGELSFMYIPKNEAEITGTAAQQALGVQNALLASAAGINIAQAQTPPQPVPLRIVWWSDAQAIKDKIDLARKLGIRGVAIFKIDGGADPAIWDVLK